MTPIIDKIKTKQGARALKMANVMNPHSFAELNVTFQ
jgi:hypothetical protein